MTTARLELPPKLIPIFTGTADIRGSYGGRGSAKTRTFAKMTAVRAYMWDKAEREGIILCGRQFMNSLDDSSLEEIKAAIRSEPWLSAHFEIGEKYIRTKSGRISYKFVGLDRNVDSVKSKSRILLCWVDEAEPVTEEAWAKLIPTLREEDSELWVTWNPESKRSPTHKRFRQSGDDRMKVAEMNWRDNPWFPAILNRTRLKDQKERPDSYSYIWEGDFAVAFEGAYYVRELNAAQAEGRIGRVAYEPELPVHTAWDLGYGDATAIWFFQVVGNEVRLIDHYENHGKALSHYVEIIKERGYRQGIDYVPHDARVHELGSGRSRIETLIGLERKPRVVADLSLEDGINAARLTIPHCWFDEEKAAGGLEALRQYRTEFDAKGDTFKDRPRHDWTSHSADAFRYLAIAWREQIIVPEPDELKPVKEINDYTIDEMWAQKSLVKDRV